MKRTLPVDDVTLTAVFDVLTKLLLAYDTRLHVRRSSTSSRARIKKVSWHLYGKKPVRITRNRKAQPTYFAGITRQKEYVGLYVMPVYSHPKKFNKLSDELQKALKRKSCFRIKTLTLERLIEIEAMLARGYNLYKKKRWL